MASTLLNYLAALQPQIAGRRPSARTPPFVPGSYPGPMPSAARGIPTPTAPPPPAAAAPAATAAPPQAAAPAAQKRGLLDKITDPRAVMYFTNVASALAQPRQQGQSEMQQFTSAFIHGLGALGYAGELERQRSMEERKLGLEERKVKSDETRTAADIEKGKREVSVSESRSATEAGRAAADAEMDARRITLDWAKLNQQGATDADKMAFDQQVEANTMKWRNEQLVQARAELDQKKAQAGADRDSREKIAKAENEYRIKAASISAGATVRSATIRAAATGGEDPLKKFEQVRKNVETRLTGELISDPKRVSQVWEEEMAKVSAGTGGPAGAPKKGDKQTHMGATYVFDGTKWVKQ